MLRRCLAAISALSRPEGVTLSLIVVDNEPEPNNRSIAEEFGALYVHEPRRGISQARNAGIEASLALEPHWIAFIDDDSYPQPDWLSAIVRVQSEHGADVVASRIVHAESGGRSESWKLQSSAGTGGTLFSARLVSASGFGLRFDEKLAFSGGEDIEFFRAAHAKGAKIVWHGAPTLIEEVHPSRMTYRRYALRGLAHGGLRFTVEVQRRGRKKAIIKALKHAIFRVTKAILQLSICPFLVYNKNRFRFTVLEAGRNMCYAAGIVGAIFSLQHEYYRTIDGC
jgi:succinoglycan biosynthesis protein ExoM